MTIVDAPPVTVERPLVIGRAPALGEGGPRFLASLPRTPEPAPPPPPTPSWARTVSDDDVKP